MTRSRIVVLGAGVTGLTAACELSRFYPGRITLLEKAPAVGGLAASFNRDNLTWDVGSHRLHANCDPVVFALLKDLCGDELLERQRHGSIYLRDRPLQYPPSAFDILAAFGPLTFLRFTCDFLLARITRLFRDRDAENFEDFTTGKVGRSLYERFYKPYALKLYGMSPRQLAKDPAVTRVRKFTLFSLLQDLKKKLRKQIPTYLYPARGIGQVSDALLERFRATGGDVRFIDRIDKLQIHGDRRVEAVAFTTREGQAERLPTDLVVSTIPLDALHHLVDLESERGTRPVFDLRWRCLRLLHLISADKVPCPHEAYYFPETHIHFGRVSELSKYSPHLNQLPDRTALTIEVPCSENDEVWNMTDDRLAELCIKDLQRLGLVRAPLTRPLEYFSRKVKGVYPVFDLGWRDRFDRIYQRLDNLQNLYMIGRAALFLHCNIDHCMYMAIRLARHLAEGPKNKTGWTEIQQGFSDYRVRE
jgi:protoporphyrinogen oxidase